MPTVPAPVQLGGKGSTDKLRAYVELHMQALTRMADDLANQATALHPEIVKLLTEEGLDAQAGMFGRSSSAEKVATAWVKLAKKTADQAIATGKLHRALYLHWLKNIKQPIDTARAIRERGRTRSRMDV